jgi:F-type H+-transporting ATPase subunit c
MVFFKEIEPVNRIARIATTALVLVLGLASAALAQEAGRGALIEFGGAFGVGLTVIGAAYGIGKLAGSALESMARQPEVAGSIQTAMIIAAALIEGFTFYALFICSGK